MHIDRLHFRLAERRRSASLARFDADLCYTRLRELAATLYGQPWMVVSGLVEPLAKGAFTRAHSDIDIAVPLDRLDAALAAVLNRGYVLTTRVMRTHLSRDFDLEVHLRIVPGPRTRRCRHLRLWHLTAGGELDESASPSYVDVYPYVLTDREFRILDTGQCVDVRRPLAILVRLPGGATVPVEDPLYLDLVRDSRRRSGARAAGVMSLRRSAPIGARGP